METKLDQVKGVGPKLLYILRNQKIWSTYDLILHTPKAYEDFSIDQINHLKHKDKITISGRITSPVKSNPYARIHISSFYIEFMDQKIEVIAFNKPFLSKSFVLNDEVVIKGTYQLYKHQIIAQTVIKKEKNVEIKPIYKIDQIFDKTIMNIVETIFNQNLVQLYEIIPEQFIEKYHLVSRIDAYKMLHLPKSFDDIRQAKRRLKYEEAFYLQLKLIASQKQRQSLRAPKTYDINLIKSFIDELEYELTHDQKQAVNDIYRDYKKPYAHYRLILGDVGSGKTLVALLATLPVLHNREQVALMAPTELLANQHFQYFNNHLKGYKICLLTSKTKQKDKMKADIKNHEYDIIIGTHALIESDVIFDHLGLSIIDEQHKFGVSTRDELIDKQKGHDVLYLTATPIPRTLAMVAFGESNISLIKEKPKERKKIDTHYLLKKDIAKLYAAIDQKIKNKEHVYVVVPAISSDKVDDNIQTVKTELEMNFACPIFILHGQLSNEEQTSQMEKFMFTPGSILLSTTMIEVGLDIPTATLIAIYSAEYFGLSQLHQLRGRVGRSHLHSSCFVISTKEDVERLDILTKTNDGFKLSEYDLIQRGPGDFLGKEQSGYLDFKYLDLLADYQILLEAYKNVDELMEQPDFKTNSKYKYLNRYIKNTLKI
ncbi:MAG: ATP-dependent DNA helicase RecG [Acholeplasmataceae bacterium]|nr:ATP-dependent DNA helicase RecG [Acholeplasmataceae bacterium]